jgi:hypothetical protein
MRVLVSDTSVLIDLDRGALLEAAFSLPVEFAVPDLLFKRELRDHNGARLIELGLRVESLDETSTGRAVVYRRQRRALSLPDVFALELARSRGWLLLTGDSTLRNLADAEAVECHGVLWVLDQMEAAAVTKIASLHDGLSQLAAHPRCRLPKKEIRIRLDHYQALIQ